MDWLEFILKALPFLNKLLQWLKLRDKSTILQTKDDMLHEAVKAADDKAEAKIAKDAAKIYADPRSADDTVKRLRDGSF